MAEVGERHVEPLRFVALLVVAAPLAARTDADHVDRPVADAVVAIPGEVLGRELPVAGDQPLVDSADHLGAALAPVPRVEQEVEVELVAADVLGERGGGGVPRGPDHALVVFHLRDLDEAPAGPVELRAVGVPREGHAHQGPVGPIAPAVIGTHELDGIALVVAADLHAAVAARVQVHADAARGVPAEDDRLLPHGRDEEVARPRDLALVAEEEPGAGEHALELLPVDLVADEDLAADDAPVDVDQGSEASEIRVEHGHALPCRRLRRRADHSATRPEPQGRRHRHAPVPRPWRAGVS